MKDNPFIVRKKVMDKFKDDFAEKSYKEQKEKGETKLTKDRFLNEWKVLSLISNAKHNQEDAIEILRLSVEFLKEADKGALSIPLPVYLGNYLGEAFEKALKTLDSSQSENKGGILSKALSVELNITSNNRRPIRKYYVAEYMLQFIESGMSLNKAAVETSIDLDIDESTAKRSFRAMAHYFNRLPNGKKIEE